MLEVSNLSVSYGSLTIVNDVSFKTDANEWLMIVGPNGAGKSTIVKAVSQGVEYKGDIIFEGQDVRKMKPVTLAQNIGILSQSQNVTYPFTVGEVVNLGRYAYSSGFFSSKKDDNNDSVARALELTGMDKLAHQSVLTLSGGELQRTFLAQVFAQDPKLLILDEPTNHLDLLYQKQVFGLIGDWIRETGRAVISVVHDLSLAKAFGTHIMLMDKGRIVDFGEGDKVLSRENLQRVYSMDVHGWMGKMLSQWVD